MTEKTEEKNANKQESTKPFLNNFLKPTKGKISIWILLILFVAMLFMFYISIESDCRPAPCVKNTGDIILETVYIILALPIAHRLVSEYAPSLVKMILEATYIYLLSCIVIQIMSRLKKWKQ